MPYAMYTCKEALHVTPGMKIFYVSSYKKIVSNGNI